jgi:hypothetical protein
LGIIVTVLYNYLDEKAMIFIKNRESTIVKE